MKKVFFTGSLIVIAIVFISYFQSCKRESLKDPISSSYNYQKDSLFAPLGDAIEVATNVNKSNVVLNTIEKTSLKSSKYIGKKTVKNYFTITDKDKKNPYFYIVNYDGGGFSIISADKRVKPILAYSDEGFFKLDSIPSGLLRWFYGNALLIQNLRNANSIQASTVAYQWSSLSCDQNPPLIQNHLKSVQVTQCPPPPPPSSSETTVTVGPLLSTTWGQGCYFNDACPVITDGTSPCGRAYTGCVATATAQVMAYWKYPSTYNWSQMPASQGSPETARLMYDIGNAVGMDWGGNKKGGSFANASNIAGCFVNNYHYSSAVYKSNYDIGSYQIIISNLNYREPVLLNGCSGESTNWFGHITDLWDCHEWVCDGYMQTTYYTNGIGSSSALLLHMNWGWHEYYTSSANPDFNGWYSYDSWKANGYNFQYADGMVYNIHP